MALPPASILCGSFGPVDWLPRSSCAGRAGTARPAEVSRCRAGEPPETVGTGALKSPGVCTGGPPPGWVGSWGGSGRRAIHPCTPLAGGAFLPGLGLPLPWESYLLRPLGLLPPARSCPHPPYEPRSDAWCPRRPGPSPRRPLLQEGQKLARLAPDEARSVWRGHRGHSAVSGALFRPPDG